MDTPSLEKIVVAALEDIKARDIEVIDTSKLTPLFDRIVIASAESGRQTRALAQHVHARARQHAGPCGHHHVFQGRGGRGRNAARQA